MTIWLSSLYMYHSILHITDSLECSEEDICNIAGYDFNWKCVGRRLLCDQKIPDIDSDKLDSEAEKWENMLLLWKRTKSHDTTYQALVKVLRALENNSTADRIEELERKKTTGNK